MSKFYGESERAYAIFSSKLNRTLQALSLSMNSMPSRQNAKKSRAKWEDVSSLSSTH